MKVNTSLKKCTCKLDLNFPDLIHSLDTIFFRPLLYGILAHFLQGGHNEGRRLRGLRDESLLRPHSRGIIHMAVQIDLGLS